MGENEITSILQFVGGLGMFLYGMQIMSGGMQKAAGSRMSSFLRTVTDNRVMGVIMGAVVTAIVQSSSATTVMVVGFVNAGILSLLQATGVIMGANIGTTITAWIVSLSQVGDAFSIFRPEFFAPILFTGGVFYLLMHSGKKDMLAAEIATGIGLLFIGLNYMFTSIEPYSELPIFAEIFATLGRNPILGVLSGAVITGIIQSSAASISVLQSLSLTGAVNKSSAVYIMLGQNIGTCVTALISSVGTNRNAKRAAVIHLLFNVIGAVIYSCLMLIVTAVAPEFAASPMSIVEISLFHTVFNTTNTILLFPFASQLVTLSGILVREKKGVETPAVNYQGEAQEMAKRLDARLLRNPALAVSAADEEVRRMGDRVLRSLECSMRAILERDTTLAASVEYDEESVDQMEGILTGYLIKVNNLALTMRQKEHVNHLFYMISDFERIGDHANNLAETADYLTERAIDFTDTGREDLTTVFAKAKSAFRNALEAFQTGDLDYARACGKDEDEVDSMNEELREKHIERLSDGRCKPQAGVVFLDILTNLERVSDHAVNVAGYVKDEA